LEEHDIDDDVSQATYRPAASQSPNITKDVPTVNTKPFQGVMNKMGTGLAAVVAIPLALLSIVISTALPILIVIALFKGPGDTWNMVRAWVPGSGDGDGSAACEGFDDWFSSSDTRASEAYTLVESVQKREVDDQAGLRSISTDFQAMVTEQRQSNPPPEAEKLNSLMVDAYSLWAETTMAASNRDYTSLQAYEAEYQELTLQWDAEDKRVRQACL
jgi:hypothetical protein